MRAPPYTIRPPKLSSGLPADQRRGKERERWAGIRCCAANTHRRRQRHEGVHGRIRRIQGAEASAQPTTSRPPSPVAVTSPRPARPPLIWSR